MWDAIRRRHKGHNLGMLLGRERERRAIDDALAPRERAAAPCWR